MSTKILQELSQGREATIDGTHPTPLFTDGASRISLNAASLAGTSPKPDLDAAYSALHFGTIVPPLSPWVGVERMLPGHVYRGTEDLGPVQLESPPRIWEMDEEAQADEIERRVDEHILGSVGDGLHPAVLFSGGVDSGLIAARCAALGLEDTLLLNYSFGENDPESQIAERMATHLGLRFERFGKTRPESACLEAPAETFPLPFGDGSTPRISDFARQVCDRLEGENRVVLDGCGADGSFGLGRKIMAYEGLDRVPLAARRAASRILGTGNWGSSRRERTLRVLSNSAIGHTPSAFPTISTLDGELYDCPDGSDVRALLRDWIEGWAQPGMRACIVAAILAYMSTGRMIQNAYPILTARGLRVEYPFMTPLMLASAMESADHWRGPIRKLPLKRALARRVPREWVDRPKSCFIDPNAMVFYDSEFIEYLRDTASDDSPLSPLVKKDGIEKAARLLGAGTTLPRSTFTGLWTLVFTDRWYRSAV